MSPTTPGLIPGTNRGKPSGVDPNADHETGLGPDLGTGLGTGLGPDPGAVIHRSTAKVVTLSQGSGPLATGPAIWEEFLFSTANASAISGNVGVLDISGGEERRSMSATLGCRPLQCSVHAFTILPFLVDEYGGAKQCYASSIGGTRTFGGVYTSRRGRPQQPVEFCDP